MREIRKQVVVPANGAAYYLGLVDFSTATARVTLAMNDARDYFSRNIAARRTNLTILRFEEEQVQ